MYCLLEPLLIVLDFDFDDEVSLDFKTAACFSLLLYVLQYIGFYFHSLRFHLPQSFYNPAGETCEINHLKAFQSLPVFLDFVVYDVIARVCNGSSGKAILLLSRTFKKKRGFEGLVS